MPFASVRGASLYYEILGSRGPWVALSPGGRRAIEGVASLGRRLAEGGCRVLLHDRRNCGRSEVGFDLERSEAEMWADDLAQLLAQVGAAPAFVGGASSGCRLALVLALRHPQAVRGLLLWRPTGGERAARRLAERYYGQYIEVARHGGMAAVCETEEFGELICARPDNRERLLAMDPERFIAVMTRWRDEFLRAAGAPVIGATEAELRSIAVPACVLPGNDASHPRRTGEALARLLARGEAHDPALPDYDLDVSPREEWQAKEPRIAALFLDFIERVAGPSAAATARAG